MENHNVVEFGYEVKICGSKNFKDFRSLNLEWIKKYFKVEAADLLALDNPQEYVFDRGGTILMIEESGKVLGVCALLVREDSVYPIELAKMAVSTDAQGRGIGYALGRSAIAKARQMGAKTLYLESNSVLSPAIALYKKLGFREIPKIATHYSRCNVHMVVDL